MNSASRRHGWWLAAAVLLPALAALPFFLPFHRQDFMIFLLLDVMLVVSYRLVTLSGEWSLIHMVLMGCGGYASALLSKRADLLVWLSIPLAALLTAAVALLLSFPLLRMRGFYFLIGSYAAGEAVRLAWKYFVYPFGGPKGLKLIPPLELQLPFLEQPLSFVEPIPFYLLLLVVTCVSLLLLYRLEHSRIGLTLHMVHWQPSLAEAVGVNSWRYRTLAFACGAFFAGLAGALFVHYLGSINPNQFAIGEMLYILVWVIIGGTRTFAGPVIGVVVLSVLNEIFRQYDEWRPAIYGLILLLSMRFLPDGLESLPGRLRGLWRRRVAAAQG